MNLSTIKALALNLKSESFSESSELTDNISQAYYDFLDKKFRELFSSFRKKSFLLPTLQQILEENWELIKCSFLSYTANPNSNTTRLMINIAIYLSNQMHKQTHPLALLMPGVNFESCSDLYPDLNTDEFVTEQQILGLLHTSITGNNGLYLLPVKLLTQVETRPDNPPLYNPYYNFQTMGPEHAEVSIDEYDRLCHHSALTRKLHKKISRFELLANDETHLLGQLRQLCRALRIGSRYEEGNELNAGTSAYDGIINFIDFYNQLFSKKIYLLAGLPASLEEYEDSYFFVNRKELYFTHEATLQAIPIRDLVLFKAILKEIKKQRTQEAPYLLLSVEELQRLIDDNSTHQSIDPAISPYLKREIIKLIHLSSQRDLNLKGTETTETCVATIRATLILHMTPIESVLSEFRIATHGKTKIAIASREISECNQELAAQINTKHYNDGYDKLENFAELMERLDIEYEIESLERLSSLFQYHPRTIQQLFINDSLRRNTVELFPTLNELMTYVLDLPIHLFRLYFENLRDELHVKLVPNAKVLGELIRIFDTEHASIILKAMSEYCISTIPQFLTLIQYLDYPLFQMICASMYSDLAAMLDLKEFVVVCKALHEEERRRLWIDTFRNCIFSEVQTIEHFTLISPFLADDKIIELFIQCRDALVEEISNTEELSICIAPLQTTEVCWVYEAIKPKAQELVGNLHDLETFMSGLSIDNFNEYCHFLHEHICYLVEEFEQADELMGALDPVLQKEFVAIFKSHLLALVLFAERDEALSSTHACLMPLVTYQDVFDKLKYICNPKYLYRFMLSLEHDDLPKIQRKYMKLFPSIYQTSFFKPIERIEFINSQLIQMSAPQKLKLFNALDLAYPGTSPVAQAQMLSGYLLNLMDSGPQAKRAKYSGSFES
jgi:hypothetical protein